MITDAEVRDFLNITEVPRGLLIYMLTKVEYKYFSGPLFLDRAAPGPQFIESA